MRWEVKLIFSPNHHKFTLAFLGRKSEALFKLNLTEVQPFPWNMIYLFNHYLLWDRYKQGELYFGRVKNICVF